MSGNKKIVDTLPKADGSRLDAYWSDRGFFNFYRRFRKGLKLPKFMASKADNQAHIIQRYHLRGFQFGNWVTVEDRYNYLAALYICLYDLNRVLKFPKNNIGLDGRLGIAFGARGKSSALAHFEPWSDIINITRYMRDSDIPKLVRFINSGGVGAFAHEYGHFLDFTFGRYYEPREYAISLSGDRSVSRKPVHVQSAPMRQQMEKILQMLYWKDLKAKKKEKSAFMKRLEARTSSPYWFFRAELFARVFEQYVAYKLKKLGSYNSFLSQTKYNTGYYLNPTELKNVVPEMDKLIALMRKKF